MEVTRGPRRRPRRSFASRLEPLESRALLNATIDVDADGRLTFKSDPAIASALRVSQAGSVYTFDLGAAGPDVDVASNAAGLAVTGSGTRTVTVAGPSAIRIDALADGDSILLGGAAVPVVLSLLGPREFATVGDRTDPRGLGAVTAPVSVVGPGYLLSGDALILDDRGWQPSLADWQTDLGYFTVTSDMVTTVSRAPFASVSYAGISSLTIYGTATTGYGESSSVVLSTAAGVGTRLDLGATTRTQDVDVMSTSADAGSRLTIVGGQGSLNARIDGSASPVAIQGGPGSAANTLTIAQWGMGPGTAVTFDDDGGPNALWIDSGGMPISSSDFYALDGGPLVFSPETAQGGSVVASKLDSATVVGLAPSPPVVESRPVVSTGAALTDVVVGAFTSYPARFAPQILWGDGSSSDGVVVPDPADPNHYFVQGSHTYARAGTYTPGLIVIASYVTQTMNIAGATVRFDYGTSEGVSRNALVVAGTPSGFVLDESTYGTGDPEVGASGVVSSYSAVVALYATPLGGAPILLGRSTPDGTSRWAVASTSPLPDGLYTLMAQAVDPSTGLTSALSTLPYSLVVDTVGPRIVNVAVDSRRGRILVTYRDYGGYRNRGVGVDPNEAAGVIYYDLANADGQSSWTVTSAVASPGWNPSFLRVALQINDGSPLPNGTYRFYVAAYRPPSGPITSPFGSFIYAGVRDRVFNGLDGGFTGRFPTQGFERRKVACILKSPHQEFQEQRRCDPIRR